MAEAPPTPPADDALGSIAGNAIGDHPTEQDTLGFTPYVEALAAFLTAPATRPPITISIEGDWGSGKSSFLLQLESCIRGLDPFAAFLQSLPWVLGGDPNCSQTTAAAFRGVFRDHRPLAVRFNAWRHDTQDELWAAFALSFVESLRREVGPIRALWGDVRLFLKRLHGVRAWLELLGLALSFLILIAAAVRYRAWLGGLLHLTRPQIAAILDRLQKPDAPTHLDRSWLDSIATHGAWGALASVAIAGIYKFHSSFKMPLSLDLKKYLARPDYDGHVAFIESFHLDLTRLVQSYAGSRRIFVFVDDLDRCDVPRAAELMQAINLMIGDSPNLVFVLGMDREKVAAGVALKYKDLFPFLRESAQWKPGNDKKDFTPLYFGYSYLEKFIQLSFALPIPSSPAALDHFLRIPSETAARPLSWPRRVLANWLSIFPDFSGPDAQQAEDRRIASGLPAADSANRIYRRIAVEEDSDRIRNIVRMTAVLFEFNPRRIKQFTNTFRLALFLASDQGVFDSHSDQPNRQSPEQIGKFVALLLRFPDIRFSLDQNPNLLAALEEAALKGPTGPSYSDFAQWLDKDGAIDLLTTGVTFQIPGHTRDIYSLANFDVSGLFTILPRAVRPPTPPAGGPPSTPPASSQPPTPDQRSEESAGGEPNAPSETMNPKSAPVIEQEEFQSPNPSAQSSVPFESFSEASRPKDGSGSIPDPSPPKAAPKRRPAPSREKGPAHLE